MHWKYVASVQNMEEGYGFSFDILTSRLRSLEDRGWEAKWKGEREFVEKSSLPFIMEGPQTWVVNNSEDGGPKEAWYAQWGGGTLGWGGEAREWDSELWLLSSLWRLGKTTSPVDIGDPISHQPTPGEEA